MTGIVSEEELVIQLTRIKTFAFSKHEGRVDLGGAPYAEHLSAVAEAMPTILGQMAGYLHDILEDTNTTAQQLQELSIPNVVVDTVVLVSRLPHESRKDAFERLLEAPESQAKRLAVRLKYEDLKHNLDLSRMTSRISIARLEVIQQYHEQFRQLRSLLKSMGEL